MTMNNARKLQEAIVRCYVSLNNYNVLIIDEKEDHQSGLRFKDLQTLLSAVESKPVKPEVVSVDALKALLYEAVERSWVDYVSDTGCFPDDLQKDKRGKIYYKKGTWIEYSADILFYQINKNFPNGIIIKQED